MKQILDKKHTLAQNRGTEKTTIPNNLRGKPINWLRGHAPTTPFNWLRGKKISPKFEGLRGEPHNPPQGRSSNNAPSLPPHNPVVLIRPGIRQT